MHKTLFLLLLLLAPMSEKAAAKDRHTAASVQCLDEGWRFHLGDTPGAQRPDFPDQSWSRLTLPHDWSIAFAPSRSEPSGNDGGYLPTGIGWYRRHISVTRPAHHYQLYFEGIYERPTIYVNGIEQHGAHPYGYTSYFIDIDQALHEGDNVVAVRVDNAQQKNSRWYTGSGIYRHVWIIEKGPCSIANWGVSIVTPDVHTACIATTLCSTDSQPQRVSLRTTVGRHRRDTTLLLPAHATPTVGTTLRLPEARPWSPDEPNLYTARVELFDDQRHLIDSLTVAFGFRTIDYSADSGFLLNGQPLLLNGGCLHHDNGILGAAAFDRAEARKAELMKAAGFNAVRTSHNPPSPAFLDACDRLGLLVVDEAFDGWRSQKNRHDYHELFDEWATRDVQAMVRRDRNHPSVVCWSIGNEIIERKSPEAVATAHALREAIRQVDTTRPVTSALAAWDSDWEIYDPLAGEHDIVGYNYMIHKHAADHQRVPQRVMMQTESYPRDAFRNWATAADNSYVVGDFVWTAIDYIGESGIGRYWYEGDPEGEHYHRPLFPWHAAYCGDIDLTGHRKPISHYRQLLWNPTTQPYMAVREPDGYFRQGIKTGLWATWPTWESWTWPAWEGKPIEVVVCCTAPAVRLYLNDRLVGEQPTTRTEAFQAVFTLPYEPGTLRAEAVGTPTGNRSGAATAPQASTQLTTAEQPARIRLTADRNRLKANSQDLSFVSVEVVDNQGRVCPLADTELSFSIDGPATLQATGSADITDLTSYAAPTCRAWKGRALAVVRSTPNRGTAVLTVSANGLPDARLKIKTQ